MHEITLDNIKKIQKHRYFDGNDTYSNKLNNKLYLMTKLLMRQAYLNSGKEVLLLMNNRSYTYKITNGTVDSVALSDKMLKWMEKSKSTFTAFHNHPDDTSFSLDDLEQLILHSKLQLLILCTNSCKYCAGLYKSRQLSQKETQAILYYIAKYKERYKVDGHRDALPLIEKLTKQGILYFYAINEEVQQ